MRFREEHKMADNFKFVRPNEAPTFQPTEQEFADPLGYINQIRPVAEKYGICKIRPPPNWAPPFAVDVDKFKFTPRIQKINELEAITRIKLNFLDEISKFWELQGIPLKIPVIGNKALDMYTLHGLVNSNDFKNSRLGEDKKWNMIAGRMGLQSSSKVKIGTQLKAHYEKILYPYDVWRANKGKKKEVPKKANTVKGRMGGKPKVRTDRMDPLANYICQECKGGDVEEKMLLCDGCDDSYHTFCLNPPLDDVPKGEWRCPDCLEEKLNRPNDGFGFEQAQKEYTLQQFGEMADDYKSWYFKRPVHMVPTEMVEKEFWRIVSAIDEDVTVEYGADLHTMDHGSGFPTVSNSQNDSDEMYINSGWNLNNLPVLKGSVFAHINADISGMKIPWMYVGMCFSTFCWHNEDHWSYSINYLHWGEPKTWYGVPGNRADDFENAMKSAAPELFAQAPDLLHQLVTIMNPNILMKANVPVYRMDQNAGEFIITFPRAYHAGFNQGYNFAEAVNFAPADWVQVGRECVLHYSKLNRFCVFSHDELVCAMAAQPQKLEMSIAVATYKDMRKMFSQEKDQRKNAFDWGVKESEKVEFEHLSDDGRQCYICKTTLFLSAVACVHSKGSSSKDWKLVCLKHYNQYGCKECKKDGEKHILKYRYSIDELWEMITALKNRTGSYGQWVEKAQDALVREKDDKMTLDQLREYVEEARKNDYPPCQILENLEKITAEADIVCRFAKDLIGTPAVRTRKCNSSDFRFKCTINELKMLSNQINYLRVNIPEKQHCFNLYNKAIEIQSKTKLLLKDPNATIDNMSNCIQEAQNLDVGFGEIYELKMKCDRLKWLRVANSDDDKDSVWTMEFLRKIIEDGNHVYRDEEAEGKMLQLCRLYEKAFLWEDEATKILSNKDGEKYELELVKTLVDKADDIPVALPSLQHLRDIITKSGTWLEKVKHFQPPTVPFLDDLISLVDSGASLPIKLKHLTPLQSQIDAANFWRENCVRVFLKRNSTIELIEALAPRKEIPSVPSRGKRKRLALEGPSHAFMAALLGIPHPDVKNEKALVEAYTRNVVEEMNAMKALRKMNREKLNPDQVEDALFCVCQKPRDSFMIRCELCLEWFHPTCVPLPRIPEDDPVVEAIDEGIDSQAVIAHKIAYRDTKYLGPCCARSRRPDYHVILDLLIGLNKIPLNMIEGIALQSLTDRAMKWQAEWDKLLLIPELNNAVKLVKSHSTPVLTTPVKRSDGDSDVVTPYQKIFFARSLLFPPTAKNGYPECPNTSINNSAMNCSPVSVDSGIAVRPDKEVDIAMILAGMGNKEVIHANSSEQSRDSNAHTQSPQHNGSVEEHFANGKEMHIEPRIKLCPELLEQVENLLIEGDLMEVSAEEKDLLWKVYDLANPTVIETRDLMEIQEIIHTEIENKGLSWERRQSSKKWKRALNDEKKKSPRKPRHLDSPSKRLQQENMECDEDCSADQCKQPTGKEVVWIQCDGCDLWFHLTCVGLKKRQVKNLDSYTCETCNPKKPKISDVDDGSSCDTDSKLSSSGVFSISSNKENTNGASDVDHSGCVQLVMKDDSTETSEKEFATNSLNVY